MGVDIEKLTNGELDKLGERLQARERQKQIQRLQKYGGRRPKAPTGYCMIDPRQETLRRTGGYVFRPEDLLQEVLDLVNEMRSAVANQNPTAIEQALIGFDNRTLGRLERGCEEYDKLDLEGRQAVQEAIGVCEQAWPWALAKLHERAQELETLRVKFEKRIKIPHPPTAVQKAVEVAAAGAVGVGKIVKQVAGAVRGAGSGLLDF